MQPDDAPRDDIIRTWLGEPAYLPESGFERLMQTVRTTPQQRPSIRDIGTRRTLTMFGASALAVAAVASVLAIGLGGLDVAAPAEIDPGPGSAPVVAGAEDCTSAFEFDGLTWSVDPETGLTIADLAGPLDGFDELPAAEAGPRLADLGLCFEFRYIYELAVDGNPFLDGDAIPSRMSANERWCQLPLVVRYAGPDGELRIRDDGSLSIRVRDLEPRPYREQPENGWGCPTSTDELVAMISALHKELPAGWTSPVVIDEAIEERRFDDVRSATLVALRAVRAAGAVGEALPRSSYLERLRPLFEGADTIARLEELASQTQADSFDARRAHELHERLDAEVGHWTMPVAITKPLDKGRLQEAIAVMEDALAIIQFAAEAGDDRLDEIRSRFEATRTPAEMADLRAELENRPGDPLDSSGRP